MALTDREKQIAAFAWTAANTGSDLTQIRVVLEKTDTEDGFNLRPGDRLLPTGRVESLKDRIEFIKDFFDDADWSSLGEELRLC